MSKEAMITLHATLDGFPIDIATHATLEQLPAMIARLREVGCMPPGAPPPPPAPPRSGARRPPRDAAGIATQET